MLLANHDGVHKNGRHGRPLRLGEREFPRGPYGHAPSKLLVRLTGPGAIFTAVAGLDRNEQPGGCGSVDFSAPGGGAEKFRSGVMRVDTPAKPVQVERSGATEFPLQVEETADGADARHHRLDRLAI